MIRQELNEKLKNFIYSSDDSEMDFIDVLKEALLDVLDNFKAFKEPSKSDIHLKVRATKHLRDSYLSYFLSDNLSNLQKLINRDSKYGCFKTILDIRKNQLKLMRDHLKNSPVYAWDAAEKYLKEDREEAIAWMKRIINTNPAMSMNMCGAFSQYSMDSTLRNKKFTGDKYMRALMTGDNNSSLMSVMMGGEQHIATYQLALVIMTMSYAIMFMLIGAKIKPTKDNENHEFNLIFGNPDDVFLIKVLNDLNHNPIFLSDPKYVKRLNVLMSLDIDTSKKYVEGLNETLHNNELIFNDGFEELVDISQQYSEFEKKNSKAHQSKVDSLNLKISEMKNEILAKQPESKNVTTPELNTLNNNLKTKDIALRQLDEKYIKTQNALNESNAELSVMKNFIQMMLNEGGSNDKSIQQSNVHIQEHIDVRDLKIAFVGGHDNLHSKLRKEFPKALYLHPDKLKFSDDAFTNIEYCLYFTEYCNHTLFYKVSNEVKRRGIKSGFCNHQNVDMVIKEIQSDFA